MAQDVVLTMQNMVNNDNKDYESIEISNQNTFDITHKALPKSVKTTIKGNSCTEGSSCGYEIEPCADNLRDESPSIENNSYAAQKNVAEGLMDIALLSANANQLRFLLTYNHEASTFYISLGLVVISLFMQVAVGIALLFKKRVKCRNRKRLTQTNEFLVGGVFMVTVVNILLAAFTTTDGKTMIH